MTKQEFMVNTIRTAVFNLNLAEQSARELGDDLESSYIYPQKLGVLTKKLYSLLLEEQKRL